MEIIKNNLLKRRMYFICFSWVCDIFLFLGFVILIFVFFVDVFGFFWDFFFVFMLILGDVLEIIDWVFVGFDGLIVKRFFRVFCRVKIM